MFSTQLYSQDPIKINKESLQNKNLVSTLAWAAGHNLSFSAALRSLVAHNIPLLFRLFTYCFNPYAVNYLKRRKTEYSRRNVRWFRPFFRSAVESAITDLEMGYSLSQVLEKHLRWWLPDYYIESVKIAEERECLRETLIKLGETNYTIRQRRKEVFSVMLYPLIILGAGSFILWFLAIFILPKFKRIFDDLLGGEALPALTEFVLGITNYLAPENPIVLVFFMQLPALIYYCFCTHRADWILVKIPFLRRPIIRWARLEVIQALSVYLKMNIPLHEALELICKSLPRSSFKNKLTKIKNSVSEGVDLPSAWKEVFSRDTRTILYIKSGLQTDNLPQALDELGHILQDDDNRAHNNFMKTIEPAVILMTSFIVGTIITAIFLPMIQIIKTMVHMAP